MKGKYVRFLAGVMLLFLLSGGLVIYGLEQKEDPGKEEILLGPYSQHLRDPSGEVTFESLMEGEKEGEFITHNDDVFTFGLSQDAHWIRFTLKDALTEEDSFDREGNVLYFDYSGIERLDLYVPVIVEGEEEYLSLRGGYYYEGLQDEVGHFFPVFQIPRSFDIERPLYIRVESQYSNNFSIGLVQETDFFRDQQFYIFLLALAYGVMVAMILYNFALYIALKDRTYILYVGYIFFMTLYQVGITGLLKTLNFRWGEFLEYYVIAATFTALIFALLFAKSFLEIKTYVPKAEKVIYGVIGLSMIGIALIFSGNQFYANYLAYLPGGFMPFFMLIVAILAYRRGNTIARYYILASLVLFTAVVIFVLRGIGIVGHSFFTSYAITISTAIESLLLSFALADRIRLMRKSQEVAKKREVELSLISTTDSLTGLFNRRYFDELHPLLLEESRNSGRALSLMYLDIDNFKKFNDTYGHPMGDQVLRTLAKVIRESIREEDRPCRIGGEEFAVIFPDTLSKQAEIIAERIRHSFQEVDFSKIAPEIPKVTVSIGVTTGKTEETKEEWIRRTDQALYRAKNEGRNRVMEG